MKGLVLFILEMNFDSPHMLGVFNGKFDPPQPTA